MVVSISEQIWSVTYKTTLSNHNLFIRHLRYVDNRLIFGDARLRDMAPYETLLGEGFYGRPILLETEPDQEFLGFMLETHPLELIYSGPTNISQVMSPYSASPPKVLLSGFRSRCHIVVKGAFSPHRVQQGLDQLVDLYSLAGFDRQELLTLSSQIQLHAQQGQKTVSGLILASRLSINQICTLFQTFNCLTPCFPPQPFHIIPDRVLRCPIVTPIPEPPWILPMDLKSITI